MRIVTDDGIGLEAVVAGSGPGLLLVHGFGGAKEDFADHVATLASDHTVVTFDLRGHGASDQPDDPAAYSLERLADDILGVADHLGFATFRLLGHSMGGMVARKVALAAPDRVDALVMMDSTPGPVPGFDPGLLEFAADVALNDGKAALKELLDFAQPLTTPAYERLVDERSGFQEYVDAKWENLSAVMWGALARAIARQSDDLPALAASLTAPLLVLVGEQDGPFVEASHAMREAIPGTTLVVIPGAGHSPQFENPGAWIDALAGFLATVPTPVR
ncbi:MAG: alpha/beta fold hydrolase [Actinomycetota bacterium]